MGVIITAQGEQDTHARLDAMLDARVEALTPSPPEVPMPTAPLKAPGGVLHSTTPSKPKRELPHGMRDNLAVAIELAETFNVPHEADLGITASSQKREVLAGETEELDVTKCSFFTSMALSKAGWDLSELYLHDTERIPVGYPEASGAIRLVDLFMVVNLYTEATAALVHPDLEKTTTDEHVMSDMSDYEGPFLLSEAASFVGMESDPDHMYGAPAMAVSVGGYPVSHEERMPGDVQQSLDQTQTYGHLGHSSQVHSVRGPGTAILGQPGSPTVVRDGSEPTLPL